MLGFCGFCLVFGFKDGRGCADGCVGVMGGCEGTVFVELELGLT